ncbi:MAG: hypothetical protein ACKO34_00510 [Vampirovibrionales bacterium]
MLPPPPVIVPTGTATLALSKPPLLRQGTQVSTTAPLVQQAVEATEKHIAPALATSTPQSLKKGVAASVQGFLSELKTNETLRWNVAFEAAHWTVAPLILPTLRYFFVGPPEKRGEYYVRDLTNYGLGSAVFLGVTYLVAMPLVKQLNLFKGTPEAVAEANRFVAIMAGLAVQIVNNGIVSVQAQHTFAKHKKDKESKSTVLLKTNLPNETSTTSCTSAQ